MKVLPDNIDALLISSSYNIGYLTGFFGFSKTEREGYALLTKNHTYIFASGLNKGAVALHISSRHSGKRSESRIRSWTSQDDIELIEISPRTPLTKVVLAEIIKKEKIKRLGFEKNITFAEYERFNDLNHQSKLVPTEYVIEKLRMIKTTHEISLIEKACQIGDKAFDFILTKIKRGMTEKELAFELEVFVRKNGAELSFPTIVAFGANAAIPHHVTNDKRLMINDKFILLDFGIKVDEYCSDMTRTVFFGKPTSEQTKMYETVRQSQNHAMSYIQDTKYNILASKADKTARAFIQSKGYPPIPHSLGHGIGLEVHEPPSLSTKSKATLKENMVFSIEPGIYLNGFGGVRIEDLVVLEKSGPRLLTKASSDIITI